MRVIIVFASGGILRLNGSATDIHLIKRISRFRTNSITSFRDGNNTANYNNTREKIFLKNARSFLFYELPETGNVVLLRSFPPVDNNEAPGIHTVFRVIDAFLS